jgi:hypothetical protein
VYAAKVAQVQLLLHVVPVTAGRQRLQRVECLVHLPRIIDEGPLQLTAPEYACHCSIMYWVYDRKRFVHAAVSSSTG